MKKVILLFFCLFFCLIQTKANEDLIKSQITINFERQSLDSALVQLAKESGYSLVIQDSIVNKTTYINQCFENKTISQILNVLLANTDYNFFIVGNWRVLIYAMKKSSRIVQSPKLEPYIITGKVVDEIGKGVRTAYIRVIDIKGEDDEKGVVSTNKNGSFTISTNNPNALLIIISPGYFPQVVSVKDARLIKLEPDWELLNEIITIGS